MQTIPRVLALATIPFWLACASSNNTPGVDGAGGKGGSGGGTGGTITTGGSGGSGTTTGGTGGTATGGSGGSGGTSGTGGAGGMPGACGTCTCPGEMLKTATVSDFNMLMSGYAGLDATALTNASNWTMDKDASATCMGSLKAEDSGDATQKGAAHFTGSGCTTWGADLAVSFGATPANATGYTGISFKIKGGPTNKASTVLVKAELSDAIPACGLCSTTVAGMDCYAGFVLDGSAVTSSWTTVTVPFSSFKPAGFGFHSVTTFDPSQIFALAIAVPMGSTWDLWIDDIQFVK